MNKTTELIKILSLIQERCDIQKLHSSFLITDGKSIEVKVWREYKHKTTTIFDASANLKSDIGVNCLLNTLNVALSAAAFKNVFSKNKE